jgi:S-formylglutathione hydrolase FrmB
MSQKPQDARTRWRRVLAVAAVATGVVAGTAGPTRAASEPAGSTIAARAPVSAAAPGVSSDTGAFVQSERRVNSRTLDLTIKSPSTERDTARVRLLLPDGWSKSSTRTWPQLYLLHGGFDDYTSWYDQTEIEQLAASRQVIVVLPDTSWCSAYTDWWNYGNGGRPKWETFVMTEITQILSRGYRANDRRAIGGNSMGGLGSMKLAANHSEDFDAAAAFSGNVDPLHQYPGGSGHDKPGLACLADWKRVWGDPAIPAQRAIWERNNPWNQAANLRGMSLFLAAGNGDPVEAETQRQAKGLQKRLGDLGIPVTTHYGTYGHAWSAWNDELRRAFPQLMTAIGA